MRQIRFPTGGAPTHLTTLPRPSSQLDGVAGGGYPLLTPHPVDAYGVSMSAPSVHRLWSRPPKF